MLEDSDGGPRESGPQHQRGVVELIAEDQRALQDNHSHATLNPITAGFIVSLNTTGVTEEV